MLALCSMLHATDYAKKYAGIMGTGLMLALCQHITLAYYAFYYAGIFDAGLSTKHGKSLKIKILFCLAN